MRRASGSVEDPNNPEQLRKRIMLMGIVLMMLGLRHSNRSQLHGLSPQLFHSYLSYLLGNFVWLLIAKDAEGNIAHPGSSS